MNPEPEQQASQMTPELAEELLVLLRDPKLEVKYGALNAILQYTQDEDAKSHFANPDFFELITSYLDLPQMTKLCLSTMIHFSSSESSAVLLIDSLYKVIMLTRNDAGLVEELGLLLLLNVSKQGEFTDKIFEPKEGENKSKLSPFVLQILFGFLESKPKRRWVIANVFVNVSSHEAGREYIATEKLYVGLLKYINDESDALRLAVLRILRNVAFLWEKEEIVSDLLKKDNELIDQVSIHMLVMMVKSQLVHDVEPCKQLLRGGYREVLNTETAVDFDKMKASKQSSLKEIEICVDIILILSNSGFPERKPEFHLQEFKQLISLLNFTEIPDDTKDKLEALETFCFW